ncbi:hypothetical protein LL912_00695 [Niabella sp. CC-SYL272]|uniref:hypothetical protein n=1 Tax=Niabella agricola TaxID=2891571 RepID=UPI001F3FD3DC|nr:hypothetical protein [Niabella agricola]MCF3107284.1 hypothetical protein [Niabella agricola]
MAQSPSNGELISINTPLGNVSVVVQNSNLHLTEVFEKIKEVMEKGNSKKLLDVIVATM